MTIDEAIKWVTEHFIADGIVDCKQTAAVKTIADFYDWYREQDLIKREDVIELLVQHIMLDDDIDEEQARFIAENEYRRVPKAEPPHATVDERNGDKEQI